MKRTLTLSCVLLINSLLPGAFAQGPADPDALTHWDQYKNLTGNIPDQHLTDPILQGAIDLHAHYGPDVYPRYADAFEVAQLAQDRGMRAIVLKNHFTESASIAQLIRKHGASDIQVFGAVALNTPVGGINPQAVRFMVDSSKGIGKIVWLTTHDSTYEVVWNGQTRQSVDVADASGALLPETLEVLDLIAEHDLTLATGHLTGADMLSVINAARERGISKIIVTHPMLGGQYTDISIEQLQETVALGGMVEFVATEFEDPEHAAYIIDTIRLLGTDNSFVSSDSGLVNHQNHTDAMVRAIQALRAAGYSETELGQLFRDNPARLLGLPPLAETASDQDAALATVSAGVTAAESIRSVKRLQNIFSQMLSDGLWQDMRSLLSPAASARFGDEQLNGAEAIVAHYMAEAGRSEQGLAQDQLNLNLMYQSIVSLDNSGTSARATWHALALRGRFGFSDSWEGGIYENIYRLEEGQWKLASIDYTVQYEGDYAEFGHRAPADWAVPYHFIADDVGITIPATAVQALASELTPASPDELAKRILQMQDESDVRNLIHAYGYYLDRKLYTDIAELFTANGSLELGMRGVYRGPAHIEAALARFYGAPPLASGELFDHLLLGSVITLSDSGTSARVRTTQLSQLGHNGEYARWEAGTYENRLVKQNGVWKIDSLRYFPLFATDYDLGWASNALALAGPDTILPPDAPASATYSPYPARDYVQAHYPNPITGKALAYPGEHIVTLPMPASTQSATSRPGSTALADLALALKRVIAVDAVENLNSSYGYYIDESDWDGMADTYSLTQGSKEITGVGVYVGRERIRTILKRRGPTTGRSPTFFTIHQLVQPVIHVSEDASFANARMRLFQSGGSADGSSGSWIGGIYENSAVFEDGEWKFGAQDLHHMFSASYRNGWARFGAEAQRAMARDDSERNIPGGGITQGLGGARSPSVFAQGYPPDRAIRSKQYAFPEISEPGFHYPNPVSGRMPAELVVHRIEGE